MDGATALQGSGPLQTDWVAFAVILLIMVLVALILSWPMLIPPTPKDRAAARTEPQAHGDEE